MSAQIEKLDLNSHVPNIFWVGTFVRNIVAAFCRDHLSDMDALISRLESPSLADVLNQKDTSLQQLLLQLGQQLPTLECPLGYLIDDLDLQLADLFILALCGENEQSHDLNIALTELQAIDEGARPTLHLISAILREQFSIDPPPGQLFQHRLLHTGILQCEGDQPLPMRSLRIDPNFWNLLLGTQTYWPDIEVIKPRRDEQDSNELASLVSQTASEISHVHIQGLVLRGHKASARNCIAQIGEQLGLVSIVVSGTHWQSTPLLAAACRYAGWLPVIEQTLQRGEEVTIHTHQHFAVTLAVITGSDGTVSNPHFANLELPLPRGEQRLQQWRAWLGHSDEAYTLSLAAILDKQHINDIAQRATQEASLQTLPLGYRIAQIRAQFGTEKLRTLAHWVERRIEHSALILNPTLNGQFEALAQRCLQRETLWNQLGETLANTSSTGVRALFSGESGTGKTLAASHLATLLHAPLFRLDLASVLNKYVGETEKNLGAALDEAAATDAILLLDEADALFAKRHDGSGERFSNMLTNFLLSRIEDHPGIIILTSNSRSRIDDAFTRRFDTILEFTAPGYEERLRLWQTHLGERSPGDEQSALLASYCDLPGGQIRNAVLNAAARQAVEHGTALQMKNLIHALKAEYGKLGRTLPPTLANLLDSA